MKYWYPKKTRVGSKCEFKKELLQKHDVPSRKIVKRFFYEKGFILMDNPLIMGPDLILIGPGGTHSKIYVELYHCEGWINNWPWPVLHITQTKANDLRKFKKVYTVVINKDFTKLGLVNYQHIEEYINENNLIEVPNYKVNNNEYFYNLPKQFIKFVDVVEKQQLPIFLD